MSFLDSILDDMQSMSDGRWKKKYTQKRKEPPPPTFEDDSWDKDLERLEKRRKIEKEKKEEEIQKRRDQAKNRQKDDEEILNHMSKMFDRPLARKKSGINLGDKPFIDSVAKCKVAVAELSVHKLLAVDCEWAGPRDALRTQDLCLVQIGDPNQKVYLFDVFVAGKALFDKGGLKGLLENPGILKIFHDCRWDSDILWHQMGVKLCNVFDTQIGYACYRRQQESITPLPVGLKTLLRRFALGGTHTTKEEGREGMQNQQDFWKIRPMTEVMLQYAREDVLLLPLVYRQIDAVFSSSSRRVAQKHSEDYLLQRREKTLEELQAIQEEEREGLGEEERPVPKYGVPYWDTIAKVSLDRWKKK